MESSSDVATSDNAQSVEVDNIEEQPADSELFKALPEDNEFVDDQVEDVLFDELCSDDDEFSGVTGEVGSYENYEETEETMQFAANA